NVYGPGDEVVSLLLRMVRTLPAVPTVGWGQQPFQPVWVDDLALALVQAVARTEPSHSIVDVAGPEVTTTREIVDVLSEITGRSPVSVPVPEPIVQFGAWAMEALGLDAPVTQDQVTMLMEGNVIPEGRANGLTEVFGVTPTPLREGLGKLADALPEQLPKDGSGSLRRQRYWADIQGSRLSGDQIFDVVSKEFYTLTPDALLRVGAEPGTGGPIEEGATLTLAIPLRGNIQVRCVEVADNTITLVTLEGHPLSGAIRFDVTELDGTIRFEVRSFTRGSSLVDRIGMRTFGHAAQRATWHAVVQAVVERSLGAAPDGVQEEETTLDGQDAEDVENWVEEVVMRFRRKESPSSS
ncbi:MAG TPA: DUF1990 family protein, partial [Longimicrobium sp.]|nr:DUF1990 family protein [Longimicrobium sp.]